MTVNETLLPDRDSDEGVLIAELYPTASREQLEQWAKKFDYKNTKNFTTSVWQRWGLKRERVIPQQEIEADSEELVVNLPPVKIREYKVPKTKKGDEEIQGLLISDGHAGKITNSFNKEIYRKRMETIFDSTITIKNLHSKMYPIKKLHIIALGDNVQGENPHQGSKLEEVEMGARNQVKKIAAPRWDDLICSLKQHYEEIDIDCFPGNHGIYDKIAPTTSNWDFFLYDILEAGIGKYKGINFHIHDDPSGMGIIEILGFKVLCFHGDAVRSQQGIPLFALSRRIKEWYIQFGGFDYAACGHFHKLLFDEIAAGVELIMNSTLVSNDPWALKKLGISSKPRQWTFGVHPRKGVSWTYRLIVDKGEFERVAKPQ